MAGEAPILGHCGGCGGLVRADRGSFKVETNSTTAWHDTCRVTAACLFAVGVAGALFLVLCMGLFVVADLYAIYEGRPIYAVFGAVFGLLAYLMTKILAEFA